MYTWRRPELGLVDAPHPDRRRHRLVAVTVGAAIGFYDGIFGPGTGSFLVFALVGLLGYGFLQASAIAKIHEPGDERRRPARLRSATGLRCGRSAS